MRNPVAVRHPKRGKAHRGYCDTAHTVCGRILNPFELVSLNRTAPEDRCRICWPLVCEQFDGLGADGTMES